MTGTFTASSTVTRTDSEYVASKVAADLRAMHRYYGKPDETMIPDLLEEFVEFLAGGYMECIKYGFSRGGKKVLFLEYVVRPSGLLQDNNAGGVFARADIRGAEWNSYLTYSEKWRSLGEDKRRQIQDRLKIKREPGQEPGDGDGFWVSDKGYSSHGVGAQRRTFRPA